MSCAIEGCTSHTGRKENAQGPLSFHSFPKDEETKQKWLLHARKRNWTWKSHCHVCSIHFTPDSFIPNGKFKWRRLKADAFPTLYLSDTDSLVLAGLKTGNVALKSIHDVLNIDEIEKIMDETKEGIEKQREIDELISGQLTEEDDEAVEAELEAILDVSDRLPDVPKEKFPDIEEEEAETPRKAKEAPKKIAMEA